MEKKRGTSVRLRAGALAASVLIATLVAGLAGPATLTAAAAPPEAAKNAFHDLFPSQLEQLDSVLKLLEIDDGDQPSEEKAQRLAEQASIEQARQLGVVLDLPAEPKPRPWTAAAFEELLQDHYGSNATITGIEEFGRLPAPMRAAIAETVVAFLAFENSVREASETADLEPESPPSLTELGKVIQPVLSARLGLLRQAGELRRAVEKSANDAISQKSNPATEPKSASTSTEPVPMRLAEASEPPPCYISVSGNIQAGGAQGPLRGPICINPTNADNTYKGPAEGGADYGLLIDGGGNDIYRNNAGGGSASLGESPREIASAALIDLGTGDDEYINSCLRPRDPDPALRIEGCRSGGVNGGGGHPGQPFLWSATGGAGFLFDQGGSDLYVAGSRGVNGGGDDAATGFLFDGGGDDYYAAVGGGANGGGRFTGVGLLIEAGGDDQYAATGGDGTNGGASSGSTRAAGSLIDAGGRDAYAGGGRGSNGGASGYGKGLLVDMDGKDQYIGGGQGVNGGAYNIRGFGDSASGFLFDGDGDDTYAAESDGTNGGAQGKSTGLYKGQVSGLLMDTSGQDSYTAGSNGVNGGAESNQAPEVPGVAAGLLWDGLGQGDKYEDKNSPCDEAGTNDCNGSGEDKTVVPKGSIGAQVDSTNESGPTINRPEVPSDPTELIPEVPSDPTSLLPKQVRDLLAGDDPGGGGPPGPPDNVTLPVRPPDVPSPPGLAAEGTGGAVFITGHQGIIRFAGGRECSIGIDSALYSSTGGVNCEQEHAEQFVRAALKYATGGKSPARVLLLPHFDLTTNDRCFDDSATSNCETKGDDEEHRGMQNAGYEKCSTSSSVVGKNCYDYAIDLQAWYHCPQDKYWGSGSGQHDPAGNDRCEASSWRQSQSPNNQDICHGTGGLGFDPKYTYVKPHEDLIRYCEGAKDLNAVDFSNYDAVVVSTSWPGDLWKLEDRREELYAHVNSGRGLVMLGQAYQTLNENYEGTDRTNDGGPSPGYESMRRVLPFVKDIPYGTFDGTAMLAAGGTSVTDKGREAELTNESVKATFPYTWFMESCGFDVMEIDPFDRIVTMATHQKLPPPCFGVEVNPVAVTEGNSGTKDMTFEVRLNSTKTGEQSFDYSTADGTATVEDGDYLPAQSTVTFAGASPACTEEVNNNTPAWAPCTVRSPGEESSHHDNQRQFITIQIAGDMQPEQDEILLLRLTDSSNPFVHTTTIGTIIDDDSVAAGGQPTSNPGAIIDAARSASQGGPPQPAAPVTSPGLVPGAAVAPAPALAQAQAPIALQGQVQAQGQAQVQAQGTAQASSSSQAQVSVPQAAMMKEKQRAQQLERQSLGPQDQGQGELLASGRQGNPIVALTFAAGAALFAVLGGFALRRKPELSLLKEPIGPEGDSSSAGEDLWLRRVHGNL